jgi:hypothetical protein
VKRRHSVVVFLVAGFASMTVGCGPEPGFRSYGVVETRIGRAAITCGGEVSRGCGIETAIRFQACSPAFHEYFAGSRGYDQLVHELIGRDPPSGRRWVVECGGADAMIRSSTHP